MWANATQLMREATKAVPSVRYAVGVAGVMAALALGATLFKSPQAAVLGALTMFILMVLLLLFSAAASLGKGAFHMPVLVMTWAILFLFLTSATLAVSAVFFDKPKPFPALINQLWGAEPQPTLATTYLHPSGRFEKQGAIWVEYPPYAPGKHFTFRSARVDGGYLYLYDETRHKDNDPVRVFYLRLPVAGGMAQWSFPNPFIWQDLYVVRPQTD